MNDTISNTHNSQKLNSNLTISSDNVKDNTINQESLRYYCSILNGTSTGGISCITEMIQLVHFNIILKRIL